MQIESKKEADLKERIAVLNQELSEVESRRTIQCSHCKKRTPISKGTIIEKFWHVPPSGCTGGDYWKHDEWLYFCNHCGNAERAYVGSLDKVQWSEGDKFSNIKQESLKKRRIQLYFFIEKYKRYFGERLEMYDERNMTIDELREDNYEREQRRKSMFE